MQQINLFHAQFKPKTVIFPARQMLLMTLVVVVIFAVISLYSYQRNATLEQISSLKQQQNIPQVINPDLNNPLLTAELTKLQLQLHEKEMLLDYLSNQSFGNQRGFSEILTTLSQQVVDKVWLTEFSLKKGGQVMTLHGKTSQVAQIPVYIDSLAKSAQFQGKKFSVFQLQHPSDDVNLYSFELNTGAEQQ